MPTLHIPTGILDYAVGGSGGPVCIAHQYSTMSLAHPMVEPLTAFFTCYTINVRGIEGSGPIRDPQDLTMNAAVEDLEAARQALGLKHWIVAGASTGGMIALLYALCYPTALSGLILISTAASYRYITNSIYDPRFPRAAELFQANQAILTGGKQGLEQWKQLIWNLSVADPIRTPLSPHSFDGVAPERMRAFLQNLRSFDLESDLPKIKVPTLVIAGRHDPQCPLPNSKRIAASIPNAHLIICEQSGHFPYIEEPRLFQEAIQRFTIEHYQTSSSANLL